MDISFEMTGEALRYAVLGWPVLPEKEKVPLISNWPEQATIAEAVINRYWGEEHPGAGIGALTGQRSSLVVLDVDSRNGGFESLSAIFTEEELEALVTPMSLTGGGGNHYFFRHPGERFKTVQGLLPGIDLLADGSKVTLPPSLHKNGKRYAWETSPFDVPLAPLPHKVLELVNRKRQKACGYGDSEPIPRGERNSRLTAMGGALRKQGASREVIETALLAANEHQCVDEPLQEREVRDIAKSVARYRPNPDHAPAVFIPRVLSAAELQGMVFPPPRWAVPDLIPEGLTILAGAPKTGKSFFALGLCLAVALGGIALSRIPTSPGDVLLVALEDPMQRIQNRIKSLGLGTPWPERLHLMNECPRAHEGGLDFLNGWLGDHPDTRLVVVDTLQKYRKPHGRNNNAYEADYEAAGGLKQIADRHHAGILVLHHTKKGEVSDPLEGVSGTMGLSGAADTTLVLKRARGQGKADLFITGRDIEERTLALLFDELGWKLEGNAEEVRLSESRKSVLQVVEGIGRPMTPKEIAETLDRPGGTIRRLVHELAISKDLIPLEGSRYITPNMANLQNEANRANGANTLSLFPDVRVD